MSFVINQIKLSKWFLVRNHKKLDKFIKLELKTIKKKNVEKLIKKW